MSDVLHAAKGWENQRIARKVKMGVNGVATWRSRFVAEGVGELLQDKRGRGRKRTYDDVAVEEIVKRTNYKRNGTTTLFAALNILTGAVLGLCMPRHTNKEWLKFLKRIVTEVPLDKAVHVICDNYATHKHPSVQRWLKRNPRVTVHFTPTSASWLNMVERFFRDLTENALRRGVFTSVPDLIDAIDVYLIKPNRAPKPFIWTASASDILAKVTRARDALLAQIKARDEALA